ncbi:Ribosomal protein L4/L1e, bacterial-type [Syntrophomonas zehnderi OL-4]|uniref:Large ribosomal subunit protein uL4 n=1 Tax=Syntrophomonas zehnderi OL-4 TaxID=690567 RepID=A0A0E3W2J7_9FIRM|nr:50S ribosomal protein L4 [Syntrophomonas zehnderi]CFX04301.1 Ribosomal protein L4/L1e, bacterial-type [Syntrophomonas zehnderi OL-4]CFX36531.1 Ribosomal protein L4/L1e, bacterial-type [Syntrophomonas zehnderi OL-4]
MPKVAVYNMAGAQVGEIELNDNVFGIEPNEAVMYDFVKMQLANKRQGTSSTKTRTEVRGGGRKPWRQKGTGRARVGSSRNPVWRGGGIAFGPKPRDYSYRLPQKVRRLALKSALSTKALDNKIVVVDELNFEQPKTKMMVQALEALKVGKKTLVVTADGNVNVTKSARNIEGVKPLRADFINVYDILKYDTLLITRDAVAMVEEVFA